MRTYAGHSNAAASNALYRRNLAKGQTGLSIAFDLPTQTGYDSDHELARGEVGKVGVPICHLGDMRALFDGIPLASMNTSMTINATAMWLLALYQVAAEEQAREGGEPERPCGRSRARRRTTSSRSTSRAGTYVFPPGPQPAADHRHDRLHGAAHAEVEPDQHLQLPPAGGRRDAGAGARVRAVDGHRRARRRARPRQVAPERFGDVVARISFFVNAGMRFVEEMCKMRAFVELWDELTRERYGVEDPKAARFRYGVQVNSLGLTEPQPENNVQRIVLEMLAVTLCKDARARAMQLPAWNEALGLPRPWDQQWSLRLQQVLAYETDLLEYGDLFAGSPVVEAKVAELVDGREGRDGAGRRDGRGRRRGRVRLHEVGAGGARTRRAGARIESGEEVVVGVNRFETTEPNPLTADLGAAIQTVDPAGGEAAVAAVERVARRARRRPARAEAQPLPWSDCGPTRPGTRTSCAATLACARAGVTTGEWARRAARAVRRVPRADGGRRGRSAWRRRPTSWRACARRCAPPARSSGERLRLLVGKPGLDGHSNGAEQIAVRARDAGFEVVYQGIRLTPAQIVAAAVAEDVHCVGLSVLSGSHMELVPGGARRPARGRAGDVPVVVGGIIPESDARRCARAGVARGLHAQGLRADRDDGQIVT